MSKKAWIILIVGSVIAILVFGALGKQQGKEQAQEEIKQDVVVSECKKQYGLTDEQCNCIYGGIVDTFTEEQIATMYKTGEYPEEMKILTLACVGNGGEK